LWDGDPIQQGSTDEVFGVQVVAAEGTFGEPWDARRYANRHGVPVFSFLRTVAMNLLRRAGYSSIRQSFRELACDIQ
jgi:hypothetical protein